MPTWNSRGLRGSTLEDLLNRTNEKYAHNGLALIQKIPTPITPINIDKETRHITLAYFEQRSMQKNATPTPFRLPMFIRIRWLLWSSLKSRRE